MKKRLLALALACGMMLGLAACGGGNNDTPPANDNPPPATQPAQSDAPPAGTPETSAPEAPSYEPATVRVAYMPNLGSASSLFTAIEQGYFDEVNLTIETYEFQGGPAEIAAMGSGDIDISQIGHGAHALCIEGQAVIFEMDQTSLADAVVGNASKGVNSAADLVGKTVAMSSGTSAEIILQLVLEEAGLSMDDINPVEMDASGIVTAMVSGQVDACATWSPGTVTIQNALGDDFVLLGNNSDYLDKATFPGSFITTNDYASANRDILVRFASAIEKAKVYRAANIDEVAVMLAGKLEADPDAMLQATGEGDWQGAVDCMGNFDVIKGYYEAQQQVFINAGRITDPVPVENYTLFDVMEEAYNLYKG